MDHPTTTIRRIPSRSALMISDEHPPMDVHVVTQMLSRSESGGEQHHLSGVARTGMASDLSNGLAVYWIERISPKGTGSGHHTWELGAVACVHADAEAAFNEGWSVWLEDRRAAESTPWRPDDDSR